MSEQLRYNLKGEHVSAYLNSLKLSETITMYFCLPTGGRNIGSPSYIY